MIDEPINALGHIDSRLPDAFGVREEPWLKRSMYGISDVGATFVLLSAIAEEVVFGPFGGVLLGLALNCGMRTLGWRRCRPCLSPDATGTEPLFAFLRSSRPTWP